VFFFLFWSGDIGLGAHGADFSQQATTFLFFHQAEIMESKANNHDSAAQRWNDQFDGIHCNTERSYIQAGEDGAWAQPAKYKPNNLDGNHRNWTNNKLYDCQDKLNAECAPPASGYQLEGTGNRFEKTRPFLQPDHEDRNQGKSRVNTRNKEAYEGECSNDDITDIGYE